MVAGDAGFARGAITTFTAPITAHGGEVVKSVVVPLNTTDYSAVLAEIRSLSPDVVAMFGDGARGDAAVTAATKAGLQAQITAALLYISDVDRVKDGYAGVVAAVPWYWGLDATSRAWADRFAASHNGMRPTEAQAADYSATTQWLTAVRTAGTVDADAVIRALDGHKFNDMFAHNAEFRASDHMVVHDLYIVKVKPSDKLTEPHAWFDVLATVPAATAFPVGADCKMPQ
jgi:branched-chain amino acid transport system substrate-binding protein